MDEHCGAPTPGTKLSLLFSLFAVLVLRLLSPVAVAVVVLVYVLRKVLFLCIFCASVVLLLSLIAVAVVDLCVCDVLAVS